MCSRSRGLGGGMVGTAGSGAPVWWFGCSRLSQQCCRGGATAPPVVIVVAVAAVIIFAQPPEYTEVWHLFESPPWCGSALQSPLGCGTGFREST